MNLAGIAIAAIAILLHARAAASASEQMMALGRHLSQECTTCHRLDGVDNGIPSIVGLDTDHFVETINYYRNGQRNNPAMVSVAQSLDDDQIKALSLYFGSLEKPKPASQKRERRR